MSVIPIQIPSLFFLLLIPVTISFSFNMPPFKDNINLSTPTDISGQTIHLTSDDGKFQIGGAIYKTPLHLWDKNSRNMTGFSSNFSFFITSDGNPVYGDGLAFLLAPPSFNPGPQSYGAGLGYATPASINSRNETFVAVEFDTLAQDWDPGYIHVGININSISSVRTKRWFNNITHGRVSTAWVSYNANSMVLRVDFTTFPANISRIDTLSVKVDLREHLPEHVIFGFSAGTGTASERHDVMSWNFSSTFDLDDVITPKFTITPDPGVTGKKTGLIVGLSVAISVIILVSVCLRYFFWKKRRERGLDEDDEFIDMDEEFEKGRGPKKFAYNELSHATNNFADSVKLGEGGFGGVYRGWLREMNTYVAVKRISRESKQGLKEYASEVKIISQLRHRNLVQLVGWCHERRELLLVYEFMQNGSLDFHLFKGKSILTWEIRYTIALGLASALLYLYEEWERCVVHRDIKTSNIMLDSSFNTKLGDFGLARLVDHEKGSQTTNLAAGTMGYMAPEYVITGRSSKESDIYSFGVVLLEIACGRRTINERLPEGQMRLAEWVWSLYGLGKLFDVVDPKLDAEFNEREMECLLLVGLWCIHPDSDHRPSIRQAIHVLNFEADLPTLPSVMPMPAYYYTPTMTVNSSSNARSGGIVFGSKSYSHPGYSSNTTSSSSGSAAAALTS